MARLIQHQIIARALELIFDETKWTRVSLARSADGMPCGCFDPVAVRFCAVGALYRSAADLLGLDALAHALEAEQFILAANSQSKSLQLINDVEGQRAVIAMFKVALAG
jgi:hypothetical protein